MPRPGYRPDGNCRACLVEVEGERVLAASCIRTPVPGMVVHSASARATRARRMVFELLLADMPAGPEARDPTGHSPAGYGSPASRPPASCRRMLGPRPTCRTPRWPCSSMPASSAACANAPAARCNIMMSSVWPGAAWG
ncbi:2Fe-2S iron-sulfur cluster-binding protein [Siccirubricoccus deserti]